MLVQLIFPSTYKRNNGLPKKEYTSKNSWRIRLKYSFILVQNNLHAVFGEYAF